jgi:nucleoside-diphosphate-sugar epimerase
VDKAFIVAPPTPALMTMEANAFMAARDAEEQSRIFEATADAKITAIAPGDTGAVAAKVLTSRGHAGKTYELTSDEALTGRQMAATIASVLGRTVTFVDVPPEKMRETITAIGIPEFVVVTILRYCETLREGRWYLTPCVRELLGRPATSYEAWLKTNAESLKARFAA